jgi:poly-beta-1,6-N-acetyl-D-glucosamine synthase
VRVTVVIPCRNEQHNIGAAIAGIRGQSYEIARVIVVADNCTDGTVQVARSLGVDVFETVGNAERKAGALNQALGYYAQDLTEAVLITDADSVISPQFLEAGVKLLTEPKFGAVGGLFFAESPKGYLQWCQSNEYHRYSRTIYARNDAVHVLSGTAALVKREALLGLLEKRGFVYDPSAITEDMELTLALKTDQWELRSPPDCRVSTELMTSWRDLEIQRLRWYRGAMDNVWQYRLNKVTCRYWAQQLGLLFATFAMMLYLFWAIYSSVAFPVHFSPFWTLIGLGFSVERTATVWKAGWKARLLAVAVIPEMIYAIFLQVVFIRALISFTCRERICWNIAERGGE